MKANQRTENIFKPSRYKCRRVNSHIKSICEKNCRNRLFWFETNQVRYQSKITVHISVSARHNRLERFREVTVPCTCIYNTSEEGHRITLTNSILPPQVQQSTRIRCPPSMRRRTPLTHQHRSSHLAPHPVVSLNPEHPRIFRSTPPERRRLLTTKRSRVNPFAFLDEPQSRLPIQTSFSKIREMIMNIKEFYQAISDWNFIKIKLKKSFLIGLAKYYSKSFSTSVFFFGNSRVKYIFYTLFV